MVIYKHVDGADTIFDTMAGKFSKNPLVKCLVVIRRVTYQAAFEDSRWAYELVSDLWPDIDPDSDSSNEGSDNEGKK